MKILHITNQFLPSMGGIEKFILDLCMESEKMGWECEVLCLNRLHQSKKTLPAHEEIRGIPITRVAFLDLKYYKPALLPLEKLKTADILHVHGCSALLDFAVCSKPLHKKPVVLSTHGGIFHTKNVPLLKRLYFFGLEKILVRPVELVVACSQNDFELFRKISPRVVLIENGVDLERFEGISEKKRENVFLFVGRISKNKRLDRVLDAFGLLQKKGVDFELRIAGKDWEGIQKSLEEQSTRLGIQSQVVFRGEISDAALLEEYAQASFFVSASEYEGFGISVIEAMAAGCIPVANKIPSFEQFVENGKNGVLADFENPPKTAEEICALLEKPLEEMRKHAKKTAEHYSWKSRMPQWKKAYENALGRKVKRHG